MDQKKFNEIRNKFIQIRVKFRDARKVSKKHYDEYVRAKQETKILQAQRKLAWLEFVQAQAEAMKAGVKDVAYPVVGDDSDEE